MKGWIVQDLQSQTHDYSHLTCCCCINYRWNSFIFIFYMCSCDLNLVVIAECVQDLWQFISKKGNQLQENMFFYFFSLLQIFNISVMVKVAWTKHKVQLKVMKVLVTNLWPVGGARWKVGINKVIRIHLLKTMNVSGSPCNIRCQP